MPLYDLQRALMRHRCPSTATNAAPTVAAALLPLVLLLLLLPLLLLEEKRKGKTASLRMGRAKWLRSDSPAKHQRSER